MRPAHIKWYLHNTVIVEPLPRIDEKMRQHPVADSIMLMLHNLNQRRPTQIFLSDLTQILLINSATICNKHINYRYHNKSDEPMLLSHNAESNIHQQLNHSSLPYICKYTYRATDIILYSNE